VTRRIDPDQLAMFDVADSPVPKAPPKPGTGKVTWAKYHGTLAMKCDDCMAVLAANHGNAPASRQAHYKRSQGGTYLLLCYAHAHQRREDEGLV